MKVAERNELMFRMYLNGYSLKSIGDKFHLKESTVKVISSQEKWKEKSLKQSDFSNISQTMYIDNAKETLSELYLTFTQLFRKGAKMAVDDSFSNKDGSVNWKNFQLCCQSLTMLSEKLEQYTGLLDIKSSVALQVQSIKAGLDESPMSENEHDSFMAALLWSGYHSGTIPKEVLAEMGVTEQDIENVGKDVVFNIERDGGIQKNEIMKEFE